jgi:hypothetical protein
MDASWSVDPHSEACVPESLELTCWYLYRGARITVAFNQQRTADQIQMSAMPSRSFDSWHFLLGMLPRGAQQRSCREVAGSSGGGTAHACLYHLRQDIVVAYFPKALDPNYGGIITYDYAGYRDIEK